MTLEPSWAPVPPLPVYAPRDVTAELRKDAAEIVAAYCISGCEADLDRLAEVILDDAERRGFDRTEALAAVKAAMHDALRVEV